MARDIGISGEEFKDFFTGGIGEEAYPEARHYKLRILTVFFETMDHFAEYDRLNLSKKSKELISRKILDEHAKIQALVFALYRVLRIKMRAKKFSKEKKELEGLKNAIPKNNNGIPIEIEKLDEYYEVLGVVIEKIGITKIEKPVYSPEEAVLER